MHTIKLRGPWQIQALDSTSGELPPPTETTVPGDWGSALGLHFRGQARYTRRFGLPTNLDPSERVSLVVGPVNHSATIELNGETLGEQTWDDGERRYEITSLLKPRNELQIVVTLLDQADRSGRENSPGGLIGGVCLEIDLQ